MEKFARSSAFVVLGFALLALGACGGGSGGGTVPVASPTIQVTATPPPTGPTVSIPIQGMTPATMAYQPGTSGKWTALTSAGTSVSFTLPVGTTKYSIAALCPMNNVPPSTTRSGPGEIVIQASTSDSPMMYCEPPSNTGPSVNATLFVSTNGFANTDQLTVSQLTAGLYSGPGIFGNPNGDIFGSPLWYGTNSDLVAQVRLNNSPTPIAARLVRNITFTDNGTVTLDPLTPNSDPVTTSTVTIPAGITVASAGWSPAEGGAIAMESTFAPGPMTLPVIPSPSAGDYYYATAQASIGGFLATGTATASSPSAINLPVPTTAFNYANSSLTGDLPTLNVAYGGFSVSGNRYYGFQMSWAETTEPVVAGAPLASIVATAGYLGTSTTVSYPDLSSIPGMLPNPTGGVAVAVIGTDTVVNGSPSWQALCVGNAPNRQPLANNTQMEYAMSDYFNYNAP